MGFFNKNSDGSSMPRNPDAIFGFRALAAGYILYMLYEMVMMYVKGESHDLVILIVGIVVLGGGGLFTLIASFISWRREKAAMAKEAQEAREAAAEEIEEAEEETE